MEFYAKKFDELSLSELYEILKSRAEIFLLEQNIVCQDMDNVDYDALHCFMKEDTRVIAYLRAYQSGDAGTVKVGRVLTLSHGKGIGRELFDKSTAAINSVFDASKITVNAQVQAVGYYEKLGFEKVSEEFLEEGVPHIKMDKPLRS
ncbi:MAG: GNAT family N-acetyltransferase [Ruminococcaceae bacterium]|nr:GNAT family N-acetyltransferase [Oscillospiraceae bacterium]